MQEDESFVENVRLDGADQPHVPIPRLRELDRTWAKRLAVAGALSLVVGLLAGIVAAWWAGENTMLSPAQWGLTTGGAALLLSGVILSLTRADSAPRNVQMDPRHRASKGLRATVREQTVPEDPTTRARQDYMAVEMVQYVWPILLAVPGMVLVLWAIFVPAPVVVFSLILISVWAAVRINGSVVARRYYRMRNLT